MDDRKLIEQARVLTLHEVSNLEKELIDLPTNIELRALLLVYYQLFMLEDGNDISGQSLCEIIGGHVLWIINHIPEHEFAHSPFTRYNSEALVELWQSAWQEQLKLNPENLKIMENVAYFYIGIDIQYTLELFFRAASIEPGNPHWSERCEFIQSIIDDNKGHKI